MWLHSEDPFRPSDILTHIQHTVPYLKHSPLDIEVPTLNLDNLELLNKVSKNVALTSKDDPLSEPTWMHGTTPDPKTGRLADNATACAVVIVDYDEGVKGKDLDAFYFYFYSYDQGPNITQVMEPLDQLIKGPKAESGMHFGNHVGDWEHNMVRFRDGKPIGIYYSQHEGGIAYDWDDSVLTLERDERVSLLNAQVQSMCFEDTDKCIAHCVFCERFARQFCLPRVGSKHLFLNLLKPSC